MDKSTIIKTLREMAKHPTVTLPRDCEALKAAADLLEKAQKLEPVEWYSVEGETRSYGVGMVECAYAIGRDEVVHVVTHESVKDVAMMHLPIQRQPLTDEEIEDICNYLPVNQHGSHHHYDVARAIEAAHGITGEQK